MGKLDDELRDAGRELRTGFGQSGPYAKKKGYDTGIEAIHLYRI